MYGKGDVSGDCDICVGSQHKELREQSFAGAPCAGQLDGRSRLCFLSQVIFSGPEQRLHL